MLGLLLYLTIQAAAGYAIVWLTTTSAQLSAQLSAEFTWLGSISGSIVPAAVSLINAMLPTIILAITKIEKVRPRVPRPAVAIHPVTAPHTCSGTTAARTSSSHSHGCSWANCST